ncbi:zymogen granule protein 16 homolog B [Sciurus carolinensis]|uniref:zymogen granule protein 16 homolog B n=1 Tax=Sciurus carolinensis TaxID=30640 RepID=UPI001FB45F1C|nr:zymogen granule protein 16 homolog B [Sciurus carolinensis]
MLLLLTLLALLGSPACWADQMSEMYGSNKGTFFCTSEHKGEAIKGIRVSTNILGIILNFQVKFGDSWDDIQGVPGGRAQELELGSDEYITEVHGSFLLNLKYLILCTNWARCASFGKMVGQNFSAFPKEEDHVLTGICGVHGLIGIKGIALKWGSVPLNSTAEENGYPK